MTAAGQEEPVYVLIADDNRPLAKGLAILLGLAGIEVETVHDGTEVLAAARARQPDALLLDIGLPGMNGIQVAEQMRSDQRFEQTLIIAVSAYSTDMLPGRSRQACFDHHLVKPVDFETILSLLAPLRHREEPQWGRLAPPVAAEIARAAGGSAPKGARDPGGLPR
jgi:DNA-binding response OmpR family regulator